MRARRVDANHAEVVEALRRCGFAVADTSRLGGGFPDLVVSRSGRTALVEVKDGRKPPSGRKLTAAEAQFRAVWPGRYYVVESVEQAYDLAWEWANNRW